MVAEQGTHASPRRCCTYDNRGIGNSSIPASYAAYRTRHMAADALALMGHLGWGAAHVLGMSLGGASGHRSDWH